MFDVESEPFGKQIEITLSVGGARQSTFIYMTDAQAVKLASKLEREVEFARKMKAERDPKKRDVLISKRFGKRNRF